MDKSRSEDTWRSEENGCEDQTSDATAAERRSRVRVSPEFLSAILHSGEDRQVVYIGDLSYAGAKVRNAPGGLKTGDTIKLATCLPGREAMTLSCKVAYVKGNEAQSEIGVSFIDAGVENTNALITFLCDMLGSRLVNSEEVLAN